MVVNHLFIPATAVPEARGVDRVRIPGGAADRYTHTLPAAAVRGPVGRVWICMNKDIYPHV